MFVNTRNITTNVASHVRDKRQFGCIDNKPLLRHCVRWGASLTLLAKISPCEKRGTLQRRNHVTHCVTQIFACWHQTNNCFVLFFEEGRPFSCFLLPNSALIVFFFCSAAPLKWLLSSAMCISMQLRGGRSILACPIGAACYAIHSVVELCVT